MLWEDGRNAGTGGEREGPRSLLCLGLNAQRAQQTPRCTVHGDGANPGIT